MKNILEYFPLRRYGAIALLFVFAISSLYYYFVYFPFIPKSSAFMFSCSNPNINLAFSVPKFISSNAEIDISIRSQLPSLMTDLELTPLLNVLDNTNKYKVRIVQPNVVADAVIIGQLGSEKDGNKKLRVTVYNADKGDEIEIQNILVKYQDKAITNCNTMYREDAKMIYDPFYASVNSALQNIFMALSMIFILSVIICSICEDDNQDFHPLSQIGKYYIVRVIFRALILLALFFVLLYILTIVLFDLWSPYYLLDHPYIINDITTHIIELISFILAGIILNKTLTRLIKIKPKTSIVVNGMGKEKEIEILDSQVEFNLKEFWTEISKRKKP